MIALGAYLAIGAVLSAIVVIGGHRGGADIPVNYLLPVWIIQTVSWPIMVGYIISRALKGDD